MQKRLLIFLAALLMILTACQPETPVVTPLPHTEVPAPTAAPAPTPAPLPMTTPVPVSQPEVFSGPTPTVPGQAAAPAMTPGPRWYMGIDGGERDRFTEYDAMMLPTQSVVAAVKGEDVAHEYEGVSLVDVLNYCGIPIDADLDVLGGNGITVTIPAEVVSSPGTLLATMMDGRNVPFERGEVILVVDNQPKELWVEWVIRLSVPGTRQ